MANSPSVQKAQRKYFSKLNKLPLVFNPEREDDSLAWEKLNRVGNKKGYILHLILKDIYENDMH